jgi:5-methylcytosine-specific restriction protein A
VGADVPSYPCRSPTCTAYVARRGDACPDHTGAASGKAEKRRRYDAEDRDREAKAFYNSAAWRRARSTKLAAEPVCERCGGAWSKHVHHVKKLKTNPELRLTQSNLMALCHGCHSEIEAESVH